MSELSRQDPVRRQFGLLHGMSSLLLLGQVIAAAAALAMDKEAYTPTTHVIPSVSEGPGGGAVRETNPPEPPQ